MTPASRIRAFGLAVLLAVGLLAATRQMAPGAMYAAHGAYRAQVDAMLDGRLALSRSPDALAHDLAWTPSGVQQVWGLGVPMWQLPFEALGRGIGLQPFPDRVALAVFLALVAFVLLRAFRRTPEHPEESRVVGAGAVLITFLLPGVVALVRSRIEVYEEAAIYAYGAGVGLLGALVIFARNPTLGRYLVLLLAAGLVGLIRPTVWFYGAATAAIASVLWLRAIGRRGLLAVVLGGLVFAAGGAVLFATNVERFGDGMEFGHRLNLESLPGNLVATRFSHPFERVGTIDALGELAGSLFDRPEQARVRGFYGKDLHRGQLDQPRWREYYFSTYAWPYVPILLVGLVVGALAWRRREGTQQVIWTWAIFGAAPLVVFYLHSPSLSSRYQLDLAPAFAALIVVAWRAFAGALRGRPGIALGGLVIVWALAVVTSRVHRPNTGGGAVSRAVAAAAMYPLSRPTPYDHVLPDAYDLADPTVATYTDVDPTFTRCTDELGAPRDCHRIAVAGDRVVTGTRDGRWWTTETSTLDDDRDADPVCVEAFACEAELAPRVVAIDTVGPALYLNGTGWNLDTGAIPPATYVYAIDPRFVELDVRGPDPASVRVAIGRTHLVFEGAADLASGATRLRFALPPHIALPGLRVIFIAVGPDTALDHPVSDYAIDRIAWR